ncbi:MAG: hypothetical protein ABIO38_07165 [Luteimonas sp.]
MQCKHVDCIKGLIKQKNALAQGYDALARKWDPLVLVDGAPVATVNFNSIIDATQRNAFYNELLRNHAKFARQEDAMANGIGPPAGCDVQAATSAETDAYETCRIDAASLSRAKAAMPCDQIGDILSRHEDLHRTQCLVRQRDAHVGDYWLYTAIGANGARAEKRFPPLMQTPAGRAREEAAAYRAELAELEPLRELAQKKCELTIKDVKITACSMYGMEAGQDISGKVCGDPVKALWNINTVSWSRVPGGGLSRNIDPPWQNDCVAKDSDEERRRVAVKRRGGGWMCVYEEGDTPKIYIRNFRLPQCGTPREETVRAPVERGECGVPAPPAPTPRPPIPIG